MISPTPAQQDKHGAPLSADSRRPLRFLLLLAGILAARWIWIAGLGDYGWTYELGTRVMLGEVPFCDYISTLPQLTSYTIIPFLWVLKGNLWAFSLHLYGWWLATLLVGLHVARTLGLRSAAQAAAMLLAACLSLPATHLGHAYSYAGTFFFGLTLLQLLRHQKKAKAKHGLLAGVFAGLALFAKQNIGAMAVLLGLGAITYGRVPSPQKHPLPGSLFLFTFGAAATFLPIFGYFAGEAGAREVFQQMFSDASAGKGGLSGMIFHVLPLFFFTPNTPLRELWTLVFSGGVALLFFGFLGNKLYRLQQPATPPANLPTARDSWGLIAGVIGVVALLSVVSLLDLPRIRSFFNRLHPDAIYEFHGFVAPLVFIAFSFCTALSAVCLLSPGHRRQPELFLPIVALPMILWGHELSCQGYLPFGAPLVVPLAVVLLERIGLIRDTVPLTCVAGGVLMLGVAGSTQEGFQPSSFKAVEQLPVNSQFAHLWGRPDFAAVTRELHQNVAPRIRGRHTLWLCVGGPHLAWGGQSAFSVAALFGDTYNLRSEPALMQRWQTQPPEFIFVGERNYCFGSRIFTTEALNLWLPQKYDSVWKSTLRDASLWQLRMSTNHPSP